MSGLPPNHEAFARAALPAYGRAGDSDLRLLSLSENATYLAGAGDDPIVLRVHRPGYHSLAAIRSELAWMKALREETSVVTPELVAATDGSVMIRGRLPAKNWRWPNVAAFGMPVVPEECEMSTGSRSPCRPSCPPAATPSPCSSCRPSRPT